MVVFTCYITIWNMANGDLIAFNVAAFICALFVLEFGADKFVDHTAIVARRTGIPEALIGLLTAGAEWEELVVVIASVARKRSALALGNIIGSSISNILGAFSLGLLFHSPTSITLSFDRSSKVYSLLLLVLTAFVTPVTFFGSSQNNDNNNGSVGRILGGTLLMLFVVYVASVALAISRGKIAAPELSDSDSDSDSDDDSDHDDDENDQESGLINNGSAERGRRRPIVQTVDDNNNNHESQTDDGTLDQVSASGRSRRPNHHSLKYHIGFLLLGFISICLSGYVLSHASTTISDELGTSDVTFGVVILSIATTLPEKFIAALSGYRGHSGILVANTVGSNIFLLTLCMGILLVVTGGDFDDGAGAASSSSLVDSAAPEFGVMIGSTLALTATVWFAQNRRSRYLVGGGMLATYTVFLVLEVTLIRKA